MSSDAATQSLQQGLAHHQAGRLQAAGEQYLQALRDHPRHPDALHLLGVLAHQTGRHAQARELMARAIQVNGNAWPYHYNLGEVLSSIGELHAAIDAYRRAVNLAPDRIEAQRALARAYARAGRFVEASRHFRAAIGMAPDAKGLHHELATLLSRQERHDEAVNSLRQALALAPGDAVLHHDLGVALARAGRFPEAGAAFEQAIALKDDLVLAHRRLAMVHAAEGRLDAAALHYRRALALAPDDTEMQRAMAALLERRGDIPGAIAAYREALARGAADIDVDYHLAALQAGPLPAATPPQYVIKLFDRYAAHFDQHLGALKYRTPELLLQAVSASSAGSNRDIGDLGCGTGWCGPLFRPLARSLVGVDLSPGMLAKARERGVYDELVEGELVRFLEERTGAFDLLISADVLVYIGDLAPVLAGARSALRPGGMLAFSVEAAVGEAFELRKSRRYAHSTPYLRRLAGEHGFDVAGIEDVVLRQEGGEDMAGHIALFTRRD